MNYKIRRQIKIKQHDRTDCGPACLASICSYYQGYSSIAQIRLFAGTNQRGTNLKGLMDAAKRLGFNVKGVKGSYRDLDKIPTPAIAHLVLDDELHHFVVIYQVKKNVIKIMDPAHGGIKNVPQVEFNQQWTGALLLLSPGNGFESGTHKHSAFGRFWSLIKSHKLAFFISLIAGILYGLLGLSTSIYLQEITDRVLLKQNLELLNFISVFMICLVLLQTIIGLTKDHILLKMGQQLDSKLILSYYKRLMYLPQQFFDSMQVGELISRMNDALKIRHFINQLSIAILINIFAIVCSFSLMLFYHWKLTLYALGIIPIYFMIYWVSQRLHKKTERSIMQRTADLESHLVASLNAIRSIKLLGLGEQATNQTANRIHRLLKVTFRSASNSLISSACLTSTTQLFTIGVIWAGSYFVIANKLTTGELLSFYVIIGYVTGPISNLISSNKSIHNAFVAADRLYELMDLKSHENTLKTSKLIESAGDIHFQQVSFSYGSRSILFKSINLHIKCGQTTAIVGRSGTGKSTLMALVQKLYPIEDGSITIANQKLQDIAIESLRDYISMVPQQIDLFTGTILNNIAVGDQHPNLDRATTICKKLGILSFINALPQGFDTIIGGNGAGLSGGQKQRIAMARALYKPFKLLFLDEPTSAIDSISESFILQIIEALRKQEKTVVIIAHRLSIIQEVDSVIYIDDHHKIQQGSHHELYEQSEQYRRYWNTTATLNLTENKLSSMN